MGQGQARHVPSSVNIQSSYGSLPSYEKEALGGRSEDVLYTAFKDVFDGGSFIVKQQLHSFLGQMAKDGVLKKSYKKNEEAMLNRLSKSLSYHGNRNGLRLPSSLSFYQRTSNSNPILNTKVNIGGTSTTLGQLVVKKGLNAKTLKIINKVLVGKNYSPYSSYHSIIKDSSVVSPVNILRSRVSRSTSKNDKVVIQYTAKKGYSGGAFIKSSSTSFGGKSSGRLSSNYAIPSSARTRITGVSSRKDGSIVIHVELE